MAITGKSGVSTGVDLKASEIGEGLMTVTTTASAQALMGGSAVGRQIFEAATTAAVQNIVGAGTFAGSATDIPFTAGSLVHVSGANVQTALNSVDGALERVSAASIGATAVGKAVFTAATTAAALDTLGGGAAGKQVFAAATTAAVHNLLEAGTAGLQVYKSATTAAVVDSLGAAAIGKGILQAATTAAVHDLLEAGAAGLTVYKAATTAAVQDVAGAGAVGKTVFVAATTAAALDSLGAGAVGKTVFAAATTAAALDSLGGGSAGKTLFGAATTAAAHNLLESGAAGLTVYKAATTAAAQNVLGIGAVGRQVFESATTAAAQNALGGGTVGKLLFATATTAAALDSLGGGTAGKALFAAATTAAAQTIIGAFVSANFATTAQAEAGTNDGTVMNPVLTKNAIAALAGSGGARIFLAAATAANSATLDFTSVITSAYNFYEFEIDKLITSVSANLWMRFSVDNGGAFNATNDTYSWTNRTCSLGVSAETATIAAAGANSGRINLVNQFSEAGGNAFLYATAALLNPLNVNYSIVSAGQQQVTPTVILRGIKSNTGTGIYCEGYGRYAVVSARVNAVRFLPNTGNFHGGVIRCYGSKVST